MSPILQPTSPVVPATPFPGQDEAATDPWWIGIRYQRVEQPDGEVICVPVPLTEEDLLYPQEDDRLVLTPDHTRDYHYCYGALTDFYEEEEGTVVLGDNRIDYGVKGLQPLGPDIVVLEGVDEWLRRATYQVSQEGGRILMNLEITSPSTRRVDVGQKVGLYYQSGALYYVIADRGPRGDQPLSLVVRKRGRADWVFQRPGADGRYDLRPLGLRIGVEENRLWFWDRKTGERLPDRSEALARAKDAEAKAKDAEAKAKDAEARAKDESQARADAEAKARDAEALARKEAQARADVEAKAKDAEAKAKDEARARTAAEAKAKDAEAKAKDAEAKAKDAEAKAKDAEAKAKDAEAKMRDEARARADAEAKARKQEERIRRLEEAMQQGTPPTEA